MLGELRKKKNAKKIWIFLAFIIVPAFTLWGVGSIAKSGDSKTAFAGIIAGKKVTLEDYRDSITAVRTNAIMQFGDKFNEAQKYLNLETQAWDRLLLLSEAKRRKIKTSDKEVIEVIQSYPFFQRKDVFDEKTYNEILRYVFRVQPRAFEEQTRQNIILSKLYKQLTDNVKINDTQIKDEYRKANEEISIYYISSLLTDFSPSIKASEQELSEYFSNNSLKFKQPLSFNLEYISTSDEAKKKAVLEKINKREDINKTAASVGLTTKETGLFGQTEAIPGIGWSPEILNALVKTKIGDYLAPVENEKTLFVFKLKERKEPYIPELTEIKNKVKDELIKEKSRKIAKEKIDKCLQRINQRGAKVDFDKLAKEFGLKSGSTAEFKSGGYIEGVGASDIFWDAAKGLKTNQISGIIEAPTGFYIARIKSIKPVDEAKFAKDKADFEQQLLLQKKQEAFAGFLEGLKLNSHNNF